MAVSVDMASLRRAWRKSSDGEFMWEFVPDVPGDVLEEVTSAVYAVNDAVEYGVDAFSEGPSDSGRGAAALLLGEGDSKNVRWFELLQVELEQRGLSGKVVAAREARYPRWVTDFDTTGRVLTACIGFPLDPDAKAAMIRDGISPLPLGIAPDVTREIAEVAVDWARLDIPEAPYIRRDLFLARTSDERGAAELARAAQRSAGASLAWVTRRRAEMRFISFSAMGGVVAQVFDDEATWESQVGELVGLIRALADRLDLAYVRFSRPLSPSWASDPFPPNPVAHAEGSAARGPRLRQTVVPDAYGVQVLTEAHLARAHDLSGWDVEDLGSGRFLVSHPRRESWYASPIPDQAVLARAREDFGAMIATTDDVETSVIEKMY